MKKLIISSVLRSIIVVSLAGLIAFAGEDKAKAPDSLKAEMTQKQEIQLNWNGMDNATKFGVYRAEVNEITEDLDLSTLKYEKVEAVKETQYTDKVLTTEAKTEASPALLVYYVTAVDKDGTESPRSNYAEVNLLVEPKKKTMK